MKVLKGLSIISATIAVILFIRHFWLCRASSEKKRDAYV